MVGFKRALVVALCSRVSIIFWTFLTFFVVISGPFGSYHSIDLARRALIFVPTLGLVMLIGTLIRLLVSHWILPAAPRLASLGAALVAATLLPPLVLALLPQLLGGADLVQLAPLELAVLILGIFLAQSALEAQEGQGASADRAVAAGAPKHRLLHRIEPARRGEVLAISVRDHYVDVQTGKGTVSLLLRFADAMAEVDPQAGLQGHRSYWVAWEAIEAVEREGVKLYLKLRHGARVPVSKNHRYKLEARGLI